MSESLDLAQTVLANARKTEHVEVFVQDASHTSIDVFGGETESLTSARTRGVGVRLISNGQMGYAYTAELSGESLRDVVEEARHNATASSPDDANVLPGPSRQENEVNVFDADAASVPVERKVEIALELEAAILKGSDQIRTLRNCSYRDRLAHFALASTSGIAAAWSQSNCSCFATAVAGEGQDSQTGFGLSNARHANRLDIDHTARTAVARSTRLVGAKKISTTKLPAVFDPQAAVALLGVLGIAASAEAVIKGRSLFAGKIGQRIGSDIVTIVDDGRVTDGLRTAPYDAEGVPTTRTLVVENGFLRSYLFDSRSGERMGASSTGNASRPSFKTPPGVAPSNFVLAPGQKSQEELITGIDNGFYVQELIGVHSGVNPVSGSFSVGATGLMISKGTFGQPVREVTIASTVFDLLSGVVEIGSDFTLVPGFLVEGAYGSPSLVIGEIAVAGT
ncbi:MAG: TldD/PmbA family protein [Actinomycetota bacterium]